MITIHKRIVVTRATDDELSRLNKQTGVTYNKLTLDQLNFYPNPNDGKFNLSFSTSKKEDTGQHAKNVYFIKIVRGNEAEIKKIIIE